MGWQHAPMLPFMMSPQHNRSKQRFHEMGKRWHAIVLQSTRVDGDYVYKVTLSRGRASMRCIAALMPLLLRPKRTIALESCISQVVVSFVHGRLPVVHGGCWLSPIAMAQPYVPNMRRCTAPAVSSDRVDPLTTCLILYQAQALVLQHWRSVTSAMLETSPVPLKIADDECDGERQHHDSKVHHQRREDQARRYMGHDVAQSNCRQPDICSDAKKKPTTTATLGGAPCCIACSRSFQDSGGTKCAQQRSPTRRNMTHTSGLMGARKLMLASGLRVCEMLLDPRATLRTPESQSLSDITHESITCRCDHHSKAFSRSELAARMA
jgi:hypothetical protein